MTDAATPFPMIPDFARRSAKYEPVVAALRDLYGYPGWRPYLEPLDELIDCILSQSTNDGNRDRAFAALKVRFPTWDEVLYAPESEVIDAIKPAGLSNQKGPRIQGVLRRIQVERGALNIDFLGDLPVEEAKAWLTQFEGVGPKTAAIVLCFAFNMPAFPVDTHIHRLGQRIGFLPEGISADKAHPLMEAIIPPDDYYAFHLNLIRHGREICHARKPACDRCPLIAHCDYFQARAEASDDR
ncbi:MAG TPA: endonuclease III [Candidatus Limnocylindrales bacterium]|nr:endonuclease III [Candidatus Limnocylindrales bacterium]